VRPVADDRLGNNQTLVPTQASQPLVVRATDAQGAPLVGATIAWSSSNATAGFAASTQTDSKGESSNRLTAVLPGNYALNAAIVGAQNGASVNFIFVNGVANVGALTPVQAAVGHAIDVACPALATSPTPISSTQTDFLQRCSEIVVGATSSAVPAAWMQWPTTRRSRRARWPRTSSLRNRATWMRA
jgi:hypothetical protein